MKSPSLSHALRTARAARINSVLKSLYPVPKSALKHNHPYEFLFAVMLSAQTTDKQVNKVTETLFKKYKSLSDYAQSDLVLFEKDISSIGLYHSKAKHIVATANILLTKCAGKVPSTLAELVTLPGVGRKTANVVLGHLYGKAEGIAIDTHMIRLCQKYYLTTHQEAHKIEKDLMDILPRHDWVGFTNRMIWYGREYCPAHCKTCPNCPLWSCV